MNQFMIRRLIFKDWYLNRWVIAGYIAAGIVALALVRFGDETAFYIGAILLITILVAAGAHLAVATVIHERTEKTLPFVMSLPISAMEYTTAKIVANVLIFLMPWATMVIGTIFVILNRDAIPDGLIPLAAIMLTELFAGYCFILTVALISESEGWTIGAVIIGNLFLNYFLFSVSRLPAIGVNLQGATAVWNATVWQILLAELAAILLILGAAFFFQARKKDFL